MWWFLLGCFIGSGANKLSEDLDGDGFSPFDGDCNDNLAEIYPGAIEVCDGIDNDCDDKIDEEDESLDWNTAVKFYFDEDQDGFGALGAMEEACYRPHGMVDNFDDCDDGDPLINPNGVEICDDIDNDCDGLLDGNDDSVNLSVLNLFYLDEDGDGYGDPTQSVEICDGEDGYVENADDCDDSNRAVFLDAPELCDEVDNDCDGLKDALDDDLLDGTLTYLDADGDAYGDPATELNECTIATGRIVSGGDCNDRNAAVHPNAPDTWYDGVDSDCGGENDFDADGDGYETAIYGGDDCDDDEFTIHPNATEQCDNIDSDCDGLTKDPESIDATTYHPDADGDGLGDPNIQQSHCDPYLDWVTNDDDCDDTDEAVLSFSEWYPDIDGDGYGTGSGSTPACTPPDTYYVQLDGDCNDGNSEVYPGAVEIRTDGIDQNCDGVDAVWVRMRMGGEAGCAIDTEDKFACWGPSEVTNIPMHMQGVEVLDVSTFDDHACAVLLTGEVECWGDDWYNQSYPPNLNFESVELTSRGSCGLLTNGSVTCWGYDTYGLVSDAPSGVFTELEGTTSSMCGLRPNGSVACWGYYDFVPNQTYDVFTYVGNSGCGIDTSGQLSCWGALAATEPDPSFGPFVDVTTRLASNSSATCVIDNSQAAFCWGYSTYESEPPFNFVDLEFTKDWVFGLTTSGEVVYWPGSNGSGSWGTW